jgi:hypothetical protein
VNRLDVRKKLEFLHQLMLELAGNSRISLEGDLAECRVASDLIVTHDETATLKRNTISPKLDFVVLHLEPETVERVLKTIKTAGLKRTIVHVQIEQNGVLELGAYDNFSPGSVVTGPGVSPTLLSKLKNMKLLVDFKPAGSTKSCP